MAAGTGLGRHHDDAIVMGRPPSAAAFLNCRRWRSAAATEAPLPPPALTCGRRRSARPPSLGIRLCVCL
jgi:hypothetical protein